MTTLEKPVRRKGSKGSFLRSLEAGSTSNHGHAAVYAQQPLAKPSTVNNEGVDVEEPGSKRSSSRHSRTYHIPAISARPDAAAVETRKAIMTGEKRVVDPSISGDVDLNLSFDFISTMEGGADSMASSIDGMVASSSGNHGRNETRELAAYSAKNSPRGMSHTDWGSRARKNPPTPLSLSKRRAEMGAEQASHFSPDSPTTGARMIDDDEPLTLVPLSSTRRAVDMQQNVALTLKYEQADTMTKRPANHKKARSSPVKRNAQGAILVTTSPTKRKGGSLRSGAKVPFGENRGMQNAQLERKEGSDDIVLIDAEGSTEKRDSGASLLTAAHASSLGHDSASAAHRLRQARSRQTSVQESADSNHSVPLSFKTSATSKSSTNDHGHSNNSHYHSVAADLAQQTAISPSAENVLGLFFPAQHAPAVPKIQAITVATPPLPPMPMPSESGGLAVETASSPLSTTKSTPETPYTPLFASSFVDHKRGSVSSTTHSGPRTPATAVSALFGDHAEDKRTLGHQLAVHSAPMSRGLTAPLPPPSAIAAEVIREESCLSLERPSSVPPMSTSASQADVSRQLLYQETQSSNSHSTDSSDISSTEGTRVLQKMIVSTVSSPEKERASFDLTHVTGTSIKKGPWNESPLLLDGEKESNGKGIGLGLLLGNASSTSERRLSSAKAEVMAHHTTVIVQRAELHQEGLNGLGIDLGLEPMISSKQAPSPTANRTQELLPPLQAEQQKVVDLKHSASQQSTKTTTSSVDGFAINVTPPAPVAQVEELHHADHRQDIQAFDAYKADGRAEVVAGQNRWSMKLWNVANAFRSPTKESTVNPDAVSPPQMRTLALVSKQQADSNAAGLEKHRRGHSHADNVIEVTQTTTVAHELRDVYMTAPSTTSATDAGRFEPHEVEVTRPQAAKYGDTARVSRQTLRPISGVRYLAQEEAGGGGHIRLEMGGAQEGNASANNPMFDDIRSPRVAASPSGMTPRMEFLSNAKTNRHSWTSSNEHGGQRGASPWLVPKRQSYVGARDSELYNLAANAQNLLSGTAVDEDAAHVEQILADEGLRRRNNHRSINSVPNTPVFVPQAWTDAVNGHGEIQQAESQALHPLRNGALVTFDDANTVSHDIRAATTAYDDGRRSRMSVYARPLSGISSFFNNAASTWHNDPNAGLLTTAEREHRMQQQFFRSTSMPYLHLHVRRPSTMPIGASRDSKRLSEILSREKEEEVGFLALSGRALQDSTPSQTLFLAGFLFMPWLWFIGGWALDQDGMLYVEHEPAYGSLLPSSNANRQPREADGFAFGYSNDVDVYAAGADGSFPAGLSHRTYGSARAHLSNEHVGPYLDPNERTLDQTEIEMSKRTAMAATDARFWQRISRGHTALWHGTQRMGGAMQRKQQADKALRTSQPDSTVVQWARSTFDWRGLDSYVVANRVMAMLACVVVFGGMIAALIVVATHWH